jgi:AcrR family transcriptional regulator
VNRSEIARQKVRDTAASLLVEQGVQGFTVDEVARRSGVAKTTIYRHWPSAQSLLVDTVACQIEALPTPNTGSLRSDLRALYDQILPTADIPARRRMMVGLVQAADDDPDLREALLAMMHQRSQPLHNVLELAQLRGEIPGDVDLALAADVVEGPLIFRFMLRGEPPEAAHLDALLDLVVAGLTSRVGTLTP